jgi:hypothetical protein
VTRWITARTRGFVQSLLEEELDESEELDEEPSPDFLRESVM